MKNSYMYYSVLLTNPTITDAKYTSSLRLTHADTLEAGSLCVHWKGKMSVWMWHKKPHNLIGQCL